MTSTADTAELLRLYFIQQRSVHLPGIGGFELNRIPARVDHVTGAIESPSYTIRYDSLNDIPSKEMFAYISRKRNISEWEAIGVVNNFSMNLKDQLKKGQRFDWKGIGSLENSASGQLIFDPVAKKYDFQPHLNSVSLQSTSHDADNTASYHDVLNENEEQAIVEARAGWWVAAAVIAAAALVMIFFNMVRNEYKLTGARETRFTPASTPSQYESKPAD
ncbi:MAG TPA: hypothetical protein VK166_11305 [Chitinophagaceae bacterium]|nr:hypothetical protein [Chitinophagaceae bacterium]